MNDISEELKKSEPRAGLLMNRRPIHDPGMNAAGYELQTHNMVAGVVKSGVLSLHSAADLKLLFKNLDILAANFWATVTVPWSAIVSGDYKVLPKERVILAIDDGPCDEQSLKSLADASAHGYRLAMTAGNQNLRPVAHLASVVKLNLSKVTGRAAYLNLDSLRQTKAKLLVSDLKTYADFEYCRKLGFDLFEGNFFCKPTRTLKSIPDNYAAMVQLLAALQNPEVQIPDLENIIRYDVSLSYRLLRFINSAYVGLNREVTSINHGINLVGIARLRKWASLLLFSSVKNKPRELLITATVRARMCEQLAVSENSHRRDTFFTVGLLSVLDALLDCPMDEVLGDLPLSQEICEALIHQSGPLGTCLRAVIAYEQGDWERHALLRFYPSRLLSSYLDSLEWAQTVTGELVS